MKCATANLEGDDKRRRCGWRRESMADDGVEQTAPGGSTKETSPVSTHGEVVIAALPVLSLQNELKTWLGFARAGATVLLVLLAVFLLLEILRAYLTLYELNAYLGFGFVVLLIFVAAWAAAKLWFALLQFPRALNPPAVVDWDHPSPREAHRYLVYLVAFTDRLSRNVVLEDGRRRALAEVSQKLIDVKGEHSQHNDVLREVKLAENEIASALDPVDLLARNEVTTCVRDVMLAVTLSPFRSADLLIVLYRNARMIVRIVHLYNSRPRLREQVRVIGDVVAIVATVNVLNFGEKFIEQLAEGIPGIGRVAGDIAQGVGAGLMTFVAGESAIARCRAFRGWDKVEVQRNIGAHSQAFMKDVRAIYQRNIAPQMQTLSGAVVDKVSSAFDNAWETMGDFVVEPVARTGGVVAGGTVKGSARAWALTKRGLSRAWSATSAASKRAMVAPRSMFRRTRDVAGSESVIAEAGDRDKSTRRIRAVGQMVRMSTWWGSTTEKVRARGPELASYISERTEARFRFWARGRGQVVDVNAKAVEDPKSEPAPRTRRLARALGSALRWRRRRATSEHVDRADESKD